MSFFYNPPPFQQYQTSNWKLIVICKVATEMMFCHLNEIVNKHLLFQQNFDMMLFSSLIQKSPGKGSSQSGLN